MFFGSCVLRACARAPVYQCPKRTTRTCPCSPRSQASALIVATSFGLRGCHAFADRPKQHRPCRITAKACGSLTGGHAFGVSPQGCRCSAGAPKAWHPTHFTHATHTDREMCATMRLLPGALVPRLPPGNVLPPGLCPDFLQTPSTVPRLNASSLPHLLGSEGAMLSRIAQSNIARAESPRKHAVLLLAGMLSGCPHKGADARRVPRKHGTQPTLPTPPILIARCVQR